MSTASLTTALKGGSDGLLIPAWLIMAVALPLYGVQLAMGTEPLFASLVLLFVCLTGVTINVAGGLRTVSGLLIGLCAVKLVILSQFVKIWYGQPADTYLNAPNVSMLIMVMAMLGMLTVVTALRILPMPRRGMLQPVLDPPTLQRIGLFSFVIAVVSFTLIQIGPDQGAIYTLVRILYSPTVQLAVIAVTARAILSSDRRRSVSPLVAVVLVVLTGMGLLSFSKRALLEPALAYFVTCFAFRYRLKWLQVVIVFAILALASQVLVPVITYVRNSNLPIMQRIELITSTYERLSREGKKLLEEQDYWARELMWGIKMTPYYGEPKALLDRYTLMQLDFVAHGTKTYGTMGWATLEHGFKMLVPRFLYPEKPTFGAQTIIRAHVDREAPKDDKTQWTFPLFVDGYVSFGYLGTYLFTVIFIGFLILEIKVLADRFTNHIWAVLLLIMLHHPFAELNANGYMTVTIQSMPITVAFILATKWLTRYSFGLSSTVRGGRSLRQAPAFAALQRPSTGAQAKESRDVVEFGH